MQQLHCKIGDLAIVVNTDLPQNLGQIVEVLGLPLRASKLDVIGRGHLWQVRTVSGRPTLVYCIYTDPVRFEAYTEGPVPDRCLRPVSGLTDGDAVRTDLGKKRSPPRRKTKPVVKAAEQVL